MSLRMRVIVGEEEYWSIGVLGNWQRLRNHYFIAPSLHLLYGTARNFCRIRSSGYWGKKTSAIKTLFGVSSRVAIVSLYSTRSWGLMRIVPGFSAMAWLSDHFAKIAPAESIR